MQPTETIQQLRERIRALELNEERYNTTLNSAPVLIWESGTDKLCNYFNNTWLHFTGRTFEQEYGNGWAEGVHPDDLEDCINIYTHSFDKRMPFSMQYRLRRHDGEFRWILDNGTPRFQKDGTFLGYIGSCTDITKEIELNQELKKLNNNLDLIVEQRTSELLTFKSRLQEAQKIAKIGEWELNADLSSAYWSEPIREIVGIDAFQEVGPEFLSSVICPESWPKVFASLQAALKDGSKHQMTYSITRPNDGQLRWVECQAQRITDENGTPIKLLGIIQDITSKYKSEQNYKKLQERLSFAIQGSNDGLWDWNLQTNEIYFSPRWKEILGYRDDELDNDFSVWEKLVHQEDLEPSWQEFQRLISTEDSDDRFTMNFRMLHKDDHYVPILSRAKKLLDSEGNALRLIGTHVDMSDLYAVQDAYKQERDRSNLYLDTAEVLLVALDREARVTMLNRKGQELLGYKEEELLGKVWFETGVLPEDIALEAKNFFSELITMGQAPKEEFHHYLVAKDGTKIMFSFYSSLLFDENHNCIGVLSSAMDITEKLEAEEKAKLSHKELLQSKNKLRNLLDSLSIGVIVHAPDTSITMYNPKAQKILGLSDSQLSGKKALDPQWHFVDEYKKPLILQDYPVNKIIASKEPISEMMIGIKHPDKDKITWVYVNGFPVVNKNNELLEVIINFIDITELKNKDEELSYQYRLIENIINTVPVRIFWKDEDGVYLGANKLFLEDAKLKSSDEIIGKNDFEMPWADTDAKAYKDDDMAVVNSGKSKIDFEESQTDEEGNTKTLLTSKVPLKDKKGKAIGTLGTYVDISKQINIEHELIQQKDMLHHQAHHDALTGLANRILFGDRLTHAIETAKRKGSSFALLFIDLDQFKEINDSLGHHFGDEILKIASKRLSKTIRNQDSIARLGGDEFILITEDLSEIKHASIIAQKVIDSLSEPFIVNNQTLYVSCSIGISIYPNDGESSQNLLKFADSAMYKAKDEGRNNYQYYDSSMTEIALEKVMMEAELRAALENDEFVVYYQPQVNAKTNELIGLEALVRWQHPTMGLIPPVKFIPLAESMGLMVQLDKYVMKSAMSQIACWYQEGLNPGVLAMNLTVKHLYTEGFVESFAENLHSTLCKPEWLELEITEGELMTKPNKASKILKEISNFGVELAIDDFGTGYSSLTYLKRLPINKLKIDQAFIQELPDDEEDKGITKAVIALAQSLNLKVLAEGVETKEQKDFLVENGCESIQGYFYSKPLPAEELETILKEGIY